MLTTACAASFFNIHSCKPLSYWISCSSSLYLSYKCFRNSSCAGSTANIFSAENWHRLYLKSTLPQNSAQAVFVFFTVFLNSSTTLLANSINSYSCYNVCWYFSARFAGDPLLVSIKTILPFRLSNISWVLSRKYEVVFIISSSLVSICKTLHLSSSICICI